MSLKMYITDKDTETLKFVEQYGSITTNQCANMFYNEQIYGKQTAGKHLNKLVKYNKLRVSRDVSGNENVYYMTSKLSYHDLLTLDFYSYLINFGAIMHYFKREQSWMNKKYFSDGFCCYSINNKIFFNIIETVRTHGFDKDKYKNIYNSKEPQELCNQLYEQLGGSQKLNVFPQIILIDNSKHIKNYLYINDNIEIKQLDFKFKNIATILI